MVSEIPGGHRVGTGPGTLCGKPRATGDPRVTPRPLRRDRAHLCPCMARVGGAKAAPRRQGRGRRRRFPSKGGSGRGGGGSGAGAQVPVPGRGHRGWSSGTGQGSQQGQRGQDSGIGDSGAQGPGRVSRDGHSGVGAQVPGREHRGWSSGPRQGTPGLGDRVGDTGAQVPGRGHRTPAKPSPSPRPPPRPCLRRSPGHGVAAAGEPGGLSGGTGAVRGPRGWRDGSQLPAAAAIRAGR